MSVIAPAESTPTPVPPASRMAVLLFTDIVGSTDLKNKWGTGAYAPLLKRHNDLFESAVAAFPGAAVINPTGDGYLAAFATASDAVRCALRFQWAMRAENWGPVALWSRVGVHFGEVAVLRMAGKDDVVGLAADLAARVMSLAVGGQILLTQAVFNEARQFVAGHPSPGDAAPPGELPSLKWVAHGQYRVKGLDDPIAVFEVGAEGIAPFARPAGSVGPQDETLGPECPRPAAGFAVPGRAGWVLERRIGVGGFGEVWLGKHNKLSQRRVFKFCFDAERLRSLKRELTLSRLLLQSLGDRPDIVRLHEVWLDRPPFFLESDYTPAGNLADWAAAQGGIGTLSLPVRLGLVARMADAVAAAHSVGVLHKDIKPSNILVRLAEDGAPHPVLSDFGIGILTDRSRLADFHITAAGLTTDILDNDSSRTGTRMYAPPESLAGKTFTTAGDVYALGMLLYQMVIGDLDRPLGAGWERDVADELLREDIAACVDNDPQRRLSGAGALAKRLRALDARRTEREALARALRAAERRKKIATFTGAVASVLLLLLGLAIVGVVRERRLRGELATANRDLHTEKDRADTQAAISFKSEQRALAEEKRAREALAREQRLRHVAENTAAIATEAKEAAEAITGYLNGKGTGALNLNFSESLRDSPDADKVFAKADAFITARFPVRPSAQARAHSLLFFLFMLNGNSRMAEPHFQKLVSLLSKEGVLESPCGLNLCEQFLVYCRGAELAPWVRVTDQFVDRLLRAQVAEYGRDDERTLQTVGELALRLNLAQKPESAKQCLQLLDDYAGPDPAVHQIRPATLATLFGQRAWAKEQLSQVSEAEDDRRKAVRYQKEAGDGSGKGISYAEQDLGRNLWRQKRFQESESWVQRALDDAGDNTAARTYALELQGLLYRDWALVKDAGRIEVLDHCAKGLDACREALRLDPSDSDSTRVEGELRNLAGDMHVQMGHSDKALESYQKGLEIRTRLAAADPSNAQAQRDLSVSYNRVGDVQLQLGHSADALDSYQKGLEIAARLAGADPTNAQAQRDLSISHNKVGNVQLQLGHSPEALDSYQKGLEIAHKLAVADPTNATAQRDLSVSYQNMGNVQIQLGHSDRALESYRKDLEIAAKLATADPANAQAQRDLSVSYNEVGDVQSQLGRSSEALDSYQKGLEIARKLATADPTNAQAQRDLAVSYSKLGLTQIALADAKARPTADCIKSLQSACESLRACEAILEKLRSSGSLEPNDSKWLAAVAKRLRDCDDALPKVQGSNTSAHHTVQGH